MSDLLPYLYVLNQFHNGTDKNSHLDLEIQFTVIACRKVQVVKLCNMYFWTEFVYESLSRYKAILTDASSLGKESVLYVCRDGVHHTVIFYSKQLTGAESRYSAIEQKALAIVLIHKTFFPLVMGEIFYRHHRP